MTVKAEDRDPERVCDVTDCNAWRKNESIYCRHHVGLENTPPKGNDNAVKHGAHRKPEFLKADIIDTRHEDTFNAAHEALCTRYERVHGIEPDFAIKKDLEEVAVAYVKRDLIDIYARENAADGSPLVEENVIGTDDQGRPVRINQANKLTSLWTDLRRETRLLLKDMGLYRDPETQKAEAVGDATALWMEELSE